jgi:hypothetical protein
MQHRGSTPAGRPGRGEPYAGVTYSEATGWVAWVLLGSVLLVLLGALHLGIGVVALLHSEVLSSTRADLLLPVSLPVLVWIHLLLGAVAIATGFVLLRGRRWARVNAIVLAFLAAIVNFAFVDVYPAWSVIGVVLSSIVIYAIALHGSELAAASGGS